MKAVNLLPRDEANRGVKVTPPIATGIVAGVLVVTVLTAGFLMQSATVTTKRNDLDAARAELALVPPPAPPEPGIEHNLPAEQTARVAALQTAINGRVAWDRLLRELALVLPPDVWLDHLSLVSPAAEGAGLTTTAPQQFDIAGKAYSHEGVARLLSRLQVLPDLENVTLDHSRVANPGERAVEIEFKIVAGIRPAEAAS
jgi:Fimbrial assembly protein (PilN)